MVRKDIKVRLLNNQMILMKRYTFQSKDVHVVENYWKIMNRKTTINDRSLKFLNYLRMLLSIRLRLKTVLVVDLKTKLTFLKASPIRSSMVIT